MLIILDHVIGESRTTSGILCSMRFTDLASHLSLSLSLPPLTLLSLLHPSSFSYAPPHPFIPPFLSALLLRCCLCKLNPHGTVAILPCSYPTNVTSHSPTLQSHGNMAIIGVVRLPERDSLSAKGDSCGDMHTTHCTLAWHSTAPCVVRARSPSFAAPNWPRSACQRPRIAN